MFIKKKNKNNLNIFLFTPIICFSYFVKQKSGKQIYQKRICSTVMFFIIQCKLWVKIINFGVQLYSSTQYGPILGFHSNGHNYVKYILSKSIDATSPSIDFGF